MNYWVAIIEKAIAKVMGNYSHLDNRNPINGLRMITGVPVFNVNFGNDCVPVGICTDSEDNRVKPDQFEFNGVKYNHIAASIF